MGADREVLIAPAAPPGSLGVDGTPAGCAALWSHWPGSPEPPVELADDTATGMALRAAADPDRWLAPWRTVVDDHADADGCLALAVCADPATGRRHGALLRSAAECSDFSCWYGPAPLRLVLLVNRLLAGTGDDAARTAAARRIAEDLDGLCRRALAGDAELDRSVAAVEACLERLHDPGATRLRRHGPLLEIRWDGSDRGADPFAAPALADGMCAYALSALAPGLPQLLVAEGGGRTRMWLDAPRHAWARTVRRPAWTAPEPDALASALAVADPDGDWTTGPAARAAGFSCLAVATGAPALVGTDAAAALATGIRPDA
ncbi:MAG: hypothetical protein RLZZ127_2739 [Planctomycetota bacterium]|jgi:hypothetical protein